MPFDVTAAPTSVLTPPSKEIRVLAKQLTTTQSNAFYVRKGATLVKFEALVESTNAGTVAVSVGSPTTTNHYVNAVALSTNAAVQQLLAPLANVTSFSELTADTMFTASISALPVSGKIVLVCHYVD